MPSSRRASRSGTAALEFGFAALPLITLVLVLGEGGYDYFARAALDLALREATRQVKLGNAQAITDSGTFAASFVCPALGNLLPCGNLVVNIHPITPDFYNGPTNILSGTPFCPGGPGQLMLAQAAYNGPSFVGFLLPGFATSGPNGPMHLTLSSVGFVNETFTVTSPTPPGC